MSNKLEYIVNKINRTKHDSPELEKVKDILIKSYTLKVKQLDNVVWDKIRAHDFKNEVIRNCVFIEKILLIKDIRPNIKKIETHMHAPEMNKIHFYGNYFVSAPNCVQIEGDVSIKNQLINPNALNVRNALLRKELDILKKIHGQVMARRAQRMERAKARAEAKRSSS